MAIAEVGLAPAKEAAECPPKKHRGEEPSVSRALCNPKPQSERKIALRWVSGDDDDLSAPMDRDISDPFLLITTLVWYGGAIPAMRARSGSDARVGAETVRVTRAERASMVEIFCLLSTSSRGERMKKKRGEAARRRARIKTTWLSPFRSFGAEENKAH